MDVETPNLSSTIWTTDKQMLKIIEEQEIAPSQKRAETHTELNLFSSAVIQLIFAFVTRWKCSNN